MINGHSLNRKDTRKEGMSEHPEGRKNNGKNKNKGKYNTFSLEFSKLFSVFYARIITMSDVVLNVCMGNI